MLDLNDFGHTPHVPRYRNYGALTVRWAKGTKGSGPRRRTVLTSPEFAWAVEFLEYWCGESRSCSPLPTAPPHDGPASAATG